MSTERVHSRVVGGLTPVFLAREVASMDYPALQVFLTHLGECLADDADADEGRRRFKLAASLAGAANKVGEASQSIQRACRACPHSESNPSGFKPKSETKKEGAS